MPSEYKENLGFSKALRIILFHGEKDEFGPFIQQFRALHDRPRRWKGIMFGDVEVPKQSEVDAAAKKDEASRTPEEKDVLERNEANIDCYSMLILSMDTSTNEGRLAYYLVNSCKKPDYPNGNCKLAYDKLDCWNEYLQCEERANVAKDAESESDEESLGF